MVHASCFFAAAGLAALTIAAGSKAKNCTMTRNSDSSTTVTALGCSITFPGGCEDCGAWFDPGHNLKVLECTHFGINYTDACSGDQPTITTTTTTTTTTTYPPPKCDGPTCEMKAPYGKIIKDEDIKHGHKPSHFKTWDGCRLGCQVNSPFCQSFTFGQGGHEAQACKNGTETDCKCTWYQPADENSNSTLIWVFNMGVQTFSFAEETGFINHGTVSQQLQVNPKPVHDEHSMDKITCEQAYATLWQAIKGKTSSITLGKGEHLIGGFTVGGGMPKEHEWFGIDVPLPPTFINVSIFYNGSEGSDLQGISSDLQDNSPKCDNKTLVADGTLIKLVPADSEEAKTFRWSMPQNAPGIFTRVGPDGNTIQAALRVDENNQLTMSTKCQSDDGSCGLVTLNWEKKIEAMGPMVWDFYQFPFAHINRCIKSQKKETCSVPLNAIIEPSSNDHECDSGWQFSVDKAPVNRSSLQATRELGRCVFYKISNISSSLEKRQQSPSTITSTITDLCPICRRRFENFACVTNAIEQGPEHCKLAPSATFCRENLNGTFCHSSTNSCHMDGGVAVATFNDTDKICRINLWEGCYSCTAHDDPEHKEKYVSCIAKSDGTLHNAKCFQEKIVHV